MQRLGSLGRIVEAVETFTQAVVRQIEKGAGGIAGVDVRQSPDQRNRTVEGCGDAVGALPMAGAPSLYSIPALSQCCSSDISMIPAWS